MSLNKCSNCGCDDSFLTSPAPCPTPAGCPTPVPCSEVFDAKCSIYTGVNITCNTDIVVPSGATLAEALQSIVTYFCSTGGGGTAVSINANGFKVTSCLDENIILPENATVEYVGPLTMCLGNTLTVPITTTLTII
jgi:hypothetical protein